MATDILALARETLALADGATPGPWRYGALEHRGRYVTDGRGYLFAQVDDDGNGRLIAGYREAAPELARFVERVDAVLRMEQHLVEFPGGDLSRGYRLAIDHMRRRLGLDTTEPAAALKAKEERKP